MTQQLDELVEDLLQQQAVECSRPSKDAAALKESIERNYVHVLFKATGTEVGIWLYRSECNWEQADFEKGAGQVILSGVLTLNYNTVKCIAHIDLATGEGTGRLIPLTGEEYRKIMGA